MNRENSVSLVLGGHVNGYSIVKELFAEGLRDIALLDYKRSIARCSNKITWHMEIDKSSDSLLKALNTLNKSYEYIILFPTDDLQLENLSAIYDKVVGFCYLPFNRELLASSSDKFFQYQVCDKIGIPYPKSINVEVREDLEEISSLVFPLIVKPTVRQDLTLSVFRNLFLETYGDYLEHKKKLSHFLDLQVSFLISEYVPGDDTNIYAYTCFRSQDGEVLNEWTGKKLTQFPDSYGVFSSASNEAEYEVLEQGRALVSALNGFGIIEPEFKYDHRDKKYKLMEVNLRSMMWHRIGLLSGVKLHMSLYNYAVGDPIVTNIQEKIIRIHFVLMLHEIPNLIARKGYWKHFKYNVFGGEKREWAIFELKDIKPFLYSFKFLFKLSVAACLRRFGLR